MNLYFTYIEGINRENTLDFDSVDISGAREHYFSRLPTTKMITEAFYPPYYRNSIKVDRNDIDFTSKINYMYFEFDGRNYYYFIKDIEYINEDVIQINVEMDTIVTYCDVMRVHGGLINRRFINRFNESKINRNYIRENLSEGNFLIDDKEIFNLMNYDNANSNSVIIGYFVIKLTDDPWYDIKNSHNNKYSIPNKEKSNIIQSWYYDQYFYYLIPDLGPYNSIDVVWINDEDGSEINKVGGIGSPKSSIEKTLSIFSKYSASNVSSIIYVPIDLIPNIIKCSTEDIANKRIHITNSKIVRRFSKYLDDTTSSPEFNCVCCAFNSYNFEVVQGSYPEYVETNLSSELASYYKFFDAPYVKNSLLNVKYNSFFMPVMLDNNYWYFTFGTDEYFSSVDLFKVKDAKIYCNVTYTLQGNMITSIDINENTTDKIKYNTIAMSDNVNTLDLLTDKWQDYVTYNKYSITGALAKTALNLGITLATEGMNTAAYTALYSTNRTKKLGLLSKKAQRQIAFTKSRENINDVKALGNSTDDIISLSTQVGNLKASPAKGVTLGLSSSILSGVSYPALIKYKVQDYEQVAQYYHRYGYRVDEYVDNVDNIFAYCRNRYYFNYIKFIDCDIDLTTLCANSIIEDIEQRFSDGIRYWRIHDLFTATPKTYIGDYQYDNVELDNLKQ